MAATGSDPVYSAGWPNLPREIRDMIIDMLITDCLLTADDRPSLPDYLTAAPLDPTGMLVSLAQTDQSTRGLVRGWITRNTSPSLSGDLALMSRVAQANRHNYRCIAVRQCGPLHHWFTFQRETGDYVPKANPRSNPQWLRDLKFELWMHDGVAKVIRQEMQRADNRGDEVPGASAATAAASPIVSGGSSSDKSFWALRWHCAILRQLHRLDHNLALIPADERGVCDECKHWYLKGICDSSPRSALYKISAMMARETVPKQPQGPSLASPFELTF